MLLARVLTGHDLHRLWEKQYRPEKGPPGALPAELFEQTAAQLFRMFFKFLPPRDNPPEQDAVAFTRAVNQRRAERHEPPVIPPHLFKGLPRG